MAPLLKAIYIRNSHEKFYGTTLPVFEYSGLNYFIRAIPETDLTPEKIKEYWVETVLDYYKKFWQKILNTSMGESLRLLVELLNMSIDEIKIAAVYNPKIPHKIEYLSADENYVPIFQKQIDEKLREELINFLKNFL